MSGKGDGAEISCRPKVFCLGLHKTGTTSFKLALESVGYRVADWFGVTDLDIKDRAVESAIERMADYDAAQDDPWYLLYRELDAAFPGSRFVLLTREKEAWFKSCCSYFGGTGMNYVREWFYGKGKGTPDASLKGHWIRRHEEHEEAIRNYFSERPDDLLELAICHGEGWEKLGPFLGLEGSTIVFPRANTSQATKFGKLRDDLYDSYLASKGMRRLWLRLLRRYYQWRAGG